MHKWYQESNFHKDIQSVSFGLVHVPALHFPGFFFLSSLILKEFSSEGQVFVNGAIVIYFKLLTVVNTCSQETWKFLHNKRHDFLACNSSVRSKIICNFRNAIFSEKKSVKQINYFGKFIQYLVHINVECSVIGIVL